MTPFTAYNCPHAGRGESNAARAVRERKGVYNRALAAWASRGMPRVGRRRVDPPARIGLL
jgi:hypothetical protein